MVGALKADVSRIMARVKLDGSFKVIGRSRQLAHEFSAKLRT
jgi:hypothetical protein